MKPIVILLVEDDLDDAELTQLALKQQGIVERVVVARDGAEALDYFNAHREGPNAEDETETIVLLDVNLPRIDGFEVCHRLRQMQTDRPPYIIMLTVKGQKADLVRGLDVGADDYLPKPFDSDELNARIGGRPADSDAARPDGGKGPQAAGSARRYQRPGTGILRVRFHPIARVGLASAGTGK